MARKNQKLVLIGIDLSVAEPSLSVYSPSPDIENKTYVWKFEKKNYDIDVERYVDVSTSLIKVIECFPENNVRILMEDYAPGAKGKTNSIAENGGIFKYKLLYFNPMEPENIMLCSVQHLKMFVTSKGNAKKELMIKEVFKKWSFDTNNNNEADAYGLSMILKALYYPEKMKLTSYQKEILDRIIKYNQKNTI